MDTVDVINYIVAGYAVTILVLGTLLLTSWRQKSKSVQKFADLEDTQRSLET